MQAFNADFIHALELARSGKIDEALARYRTIAFSREAPAELRGTAYLYIAQELAARGDHLGAIKHYQLAEPLLPNRAELHLRFGRSLLELGDRSGAIRRLEKSVELDGQSADARRTLEEAESRATRDGPGQPIDLLDLPKTDLPPDILDPILEGLKAADPMKRRLALLRFREHKPIGHLEALVPLLEDKDADVRTLAERTYAAFVGSGGGTGASRARGETEPPATSGLDINQLVVEIGKEIEATHGPLRERKTVDLDLVESFLEARGWQYLERRDPFLVTRVNMETWIATAAFKVDSDRNLLLISIRGFPFVPDTHPKLAEVQAFLMEHNYHNLIGRFGRKPPDGEIMVDHVDSVQAGLTYDEFNTLLDTVLSLANEGYPKLMALLGTKP